MKKLLSIIIAVTLVLSLAACGNQAGTGKDVSPSPSPSTSTSATPSAPANEKVYGDPIIIGLTLPVTGDQAAGGLQARSGAELKINEVNDAGGIKIGDKWHLLEMRIEDDQGNSDLCLNTVNKLASEGAVAILGPYFSGQTIALNDTVKELGIALINSATSVKIPELKNPWLWRNRCDDGINVQIMGKAIIDDGATKIGIMCVNDETGTAAAEGYMRYFESKGIPYHVEWHTKSDTDLTAQISKALAAGVDGWVSSTHDIAAVALAKGMYELGLRDQKVYMNPILAQAQVLDMMEPEWVEGWRCVSDFSYTDTREAQAAFTEKFVKKYNMNPDVQGALYYSHATVLIDAIQRANSTDRKAIRDAIAQTNGLVTIVGTSYASEYTNLMYEIGIAEIQDLVPVIIGSVSVAEDYGFGK
jgi:branched-chain amino acid transport system substrate-binding protein